MALISYSESINYTLLEQYRDMLGADGVAHSLATLTELLPSYLEELKQHASKQQEDAFRRQAHKVKGGAHSLGFVRIGAAMQFLERDHWNWDQANRVIAECEQWLSTDIPEVTAWLGHDTL